MSFQEVCKILINTETAYKNSAPHLLATGIGSYTQGISCAVEFKYDDVYEREDNYHDVVGFYHTHPSGLNQMSPTDIETMTQWVKCLGKSLICLIETDEQLNGWLFTKSEDGDIIYREVKSLTGNDVNYDIWLENKVDFWSAADFLLEEDFSSEMDEEKILIDAMQDSLSEIEENQKAILVSLNSLTSIVGSLVSALVQDE